MAAGNGTLWRGGTCIASLGRVVCVTYDAHSPFACLASATLRFDIPKQGFFADLELVSKARTGFVGQPRRSSTQLLLDLVEYDRKREVRDKYGIAAATNMEKLKLCTYWRPQ
jgi:hypothetical protein